MKKHPRPIAAWIEKHTPFLKLFLIIILIGGIVNFTIYAYYSFMTFRFSQRYYMESAKGAVLESFNKTMDYFAENPEAMERYLPDGINIPDNISITMKKVQDSDIPHETWHLVGWKEAGNGETYRSERCFTVPKTSDNQSN
ncbi:hypothetical protein KJ657_03195 [Patescibacteria group bacterium]|nr:hypothetical protein [Patescibacteria group bacterium]MBU1016070.1 hypothetical protein [Patescibacteria group bacterium]MBU1684912.1 hypothetical protein [Patescibacteria group bacterium]MBU1938360.1 hypothetical protein [Patescibacteria group bacterium]